MVLLSKDSLLSMNNLMFSFGNYFVNQMHNRLGSTEDVTHSLSFDDITRLNVIRYLLLIKVLMTSLFPFAIIGCLWMTLFLFGVDDVRLGDRVQVKAEPLLIFILLIFLWNRPVITFLSFHREASKIREKFCFPRSK